ncbi:MAG: ABC transporter permease [Spirochaetales bacterium]|nr:ABC transporter permease [Spirochaetales bacterium]
MKKQLSPWVNRSLYILILLVVWEATARYSGVSPLVLPPVSGVFKVLFSSLLDGSLAANTLLSLGLIAAGLGIGSTLGILLAVGAARWKPARDLVDTLLLIFHPLPGIALFPLVILWFGVGYFSIVILIVHSVLWPMVTNLLSGFESLPEIYRMVGTNYQLKPAAFSFYILLPGSFPQFIAGFKIGWARAWRALISAEMIFGAAGGLGGLGWFIFKRRVFMDTPGIFAGLIVIIVIGMLVEDLIFTAVEKRTVLRWGMKS